MGNGGWKKRYERVLRMGPDEVRERLRQQFMARWDFLRYRAGLGFSVRKNLAAGQPPRFFFSADEVPVLCARLRERLPTQAEEIIRRSERICQHRFDLLGY